MFLWILYEHWLVIASCLVACIWPIAYIRSMIHWKAKPNLISRFLRGIIPLIGIWAALSANADLRASIRVLLAGIMPLIIFCTAFFYKQSYWKLSVFDYICGLIACIALVFWLVAKNPIIALWLTIIADCIASLPTIVKAWNKHNAEVQKLPSRSLNATVFIILIGLLLAGGFLLIFRKLKG